MKKAVSLLLIIIMMMMISLSACKNNVPMYTDTNNSDTKEEQLVIDKDVIEQDIHSSNSDTINQTTPDNNVDSSDKTGSTNPIPNNTIVPIEPEVSKPTYPTEPSTPVHNHSYSNATCTEPAKCSCGATDGNVIPHNFKDGICLMCKKADSTAKSSEIAKENERHTQKLAELKESRDYLVGLNKDRINSIKSTYGISYVYDDATCLSKISSLDSQISDLDFEISRLEMYNDPADRKRIAELKSERNELKSQKTTYEQMRKIHDYEYAIESYEYEYQRKVAAENELHQENLAKIETKYAG